MTGSGRGSMVMGRETVVSQPKGLVCVRLTVPLPALFQKTAMLFVPCPELMLPPVNVHA